MSPAITTASCVARRHVVGIFVDGYMVGWSSGQSPDHPLAVELRERTDNIAAELRDEVIASGEGIGGAGYSFGDGSEW